MKGIVEGIARGREKKHEVIGSPYCSQLGGYM